MRFKYLPYYFLILFCCAGISNAQIVRTIAGNGLNDTAGTGGPAIRASVGSPGGIAIDNAGNLYVTDQYNNLIRKITPSGFISNFAGIGYPGYTGDGGPAVYAEVQVPVGITRDAAGNTFVAENGSAIVRKIDPYGIISTIAGHYGMYTYCCDGSPATSATLGACGITLDSAGNVYVADCNGRIREIDTSGIIHTLAGTYNIGYSGNGGLATAAGAALNGPTGVAIDRHGNIYFSDQGNYAIRKVNTSGILSTFCGKGPSFPGLSGDGGLATNAKILSPNGIKSDIANNIYFADMGNSRIRKVDTLGIVHTIVGTNAGFAGDGGSPAICKLNSPADFCFDANGNMFIADKNNHRVREVIARMDTMHITVNPGRVICSGNTVTFSVNYTQSPLYGGVYRWKLNDSIVATGSPVYTSNYLVDSDVVTCTIIDTTGGFPFAYSDSVLMRVNLNVVPSVSILGGSDTICTGFPVELIATSVHGGLVPSYQWKIFGVDTATGNIFLYYPHNGDIVSCTLVSDADCVIPDTAFTADTLIVNPFYHPFHPTVSIHASPGDTAAYLGQLITLFAEVTYGGVHPIFKWYKNGVLLPGADSSAYSFQAYFSDTFTCNVTSVATCIAPLSATSPPLVMSLGTLGINAASNTANQLTLLPNPNNGIFIISGLKDTQQGDIMLLVKDPVGRIVYNKKLEETEFKKELPIHLPENLPAGIYYLLTNSNTQYYIVPFVLHR